MLLVYFFVKLSVARRGGSNPQAPRFLFDITQGDKRLKIPLGVATYENKIFVTDSGNGLVQVFDSDGRSLRSFSVKRPEKRDLSLLSYPVGIAVDDSGKIFISDIRSKNLLLFDLEGKYLDVFSSKLARTKKALVKPLALTCANGKLYVTDVGQGEQAVEVFNVHGELLFKFGRPGIDKGEFSYPNGIAVDKDGKIFVADSNNGRIQVFNKEGKILYLFKGGLRLPRGLAIDGQHRLHVVDAFLCKVYVFDIKGKRLFSYGTKGSGKGEFFLPNGIAIDATTSRIYITDRGNNGRIQVWKY